MTPMLSPEPCVMPWNVCVCVCASLCVSQCVYVCVSARDENTPNRHTVNFVAFFDTNLKKKQFAGVSLGAHPVADELH